MRILIVGEGKSGTTALFRSVAAALDEPHEAFEPADLRHVDLSADPLVAKKLLASWDSAEAPSVDAFDRRVLILRDPRDRLISHLLYDAFNHAAALNDAQRARWLGILTRKIEQPKHVPLVWVMDAWWRIAKADLLGGYFRALQRSSAFSASVGEGFEIVKYEDYVTGRLEPLRDYLGLRIDPGEVDEAERRVRRTATHGDWRLWFTDVDVNVFRPITSRWLNRNGYDRDDWTLAEHDAIDPASSVDYVRSLFAEAGVPVGN